MDKYTSIRRLTVADLDMLLVWRNSEDVRRHMFTQEKISIEDHRSWFELRSRDKNRYLLIVEDTVQPICFVQFNHVPRDNTAEWGFFVRPGAPKGSGTRSGITALNYAFAELGFYKVLGQVLENNLRSINLHLKLGFEREGTLQCHKLLNGNYQPIICFGVLGEHWLTGIGKRS